MRLWALWLDSNKQVTTASQGLFNSKRGHMLNGPHLIVRKAVILDMMYKNLIEFGIVICFCKLISLIFLKRLRKTNFSNPFEHLIRSVPRLWGQSQRDGTYCPERKTLQRNMDGEACQGLHHPLPLTLHFSLSPWSTAWAVLSWHEEEVCSQGQEHMLCTDRWGWGYEDAHLWWKVVGNWLQEIDKIQWKLKRESGVNYGCKP